LGVSLDAAAWPLLPVFRWLKQAGHLSDAEIARTFNCGLGMVAIAAPDRAEEAERLLSEQGESVYRIGTVSVVDDGAERVAIKGTDVAWRA
jgi:phosphoribosylformylglycinamidine cyclo-ligase